MQKKENVVLIGMPGAGKSTVGVVLAKSLGYGFLDSDLLIQEEEGKLLHEIISGQGLEGFQKIEDRVNSLINSRKSVIATGGSVVYGENAMAHLQEIGRIFYLKLPYEEIESRLGDLSERGVAIRSGMSLRDLYEERKPLYEKYADVVLNCEGLQIREIVKEIVRLYQM